MAGHTRTTSWQSILAALGLALGATGCEKGTDPTGGEADVAGRRIQPLAAALTRTASCKELTESYKDDARARVDMTVTDYLKWIDEWNDYYGGSNADAGVANEDGEGASDSASPERSSVPDDFSETNTQVEGVDEADIVKTDGYHIYALSGSKLVVVKSWPAEDTALERAIDIEGFTHEMFVHEGRAIVFSSVEDPAFVKPEGCDDTDDDYSYRYECYASRYFTKITVVDAITGNPSIARELFVEGWYNSSRRHGNQVRAILSNWNDYYYWALPNVWEYLDGVWDYDTFDASTRVLLRAALFTWREAAFKAIDDTDLTDWIPRRYEQDGDKLVELAPDCENFWVPQPGAVDYGLTQITGFDLSKPSAAPSQLAIRGYAHALYASHESLLIGQYDYAGWYRAYQDGEKEYRSESILHRFELGDGGKVSYQGSGKVPGWINNQFSLDEKDGIVRAAATQTIETINSGDEWNTWNWRQENYVVTLEPNGNQLDLLGKTKSLVDDETIQSVRFVGDMAYVVTFRFVDPLFAVDLSDPANPEVLGELEIPGFSTYMHPIGEDHLLTIGYDADENGWTTGLALQIFDVSKPTAPKLAHKETFTGSEWGYSEANWNHKAFTFYPHLSTLAFPFQSWNEDGYPNSSLEVFHVDVEDGFDKLGSIDHSPMVGGLCTQYTDEWERRWCQESFSTVRRGLFIEDFVYSLSYGGIRVHELANLNSEVASVQLPNDGINNYYYGWWFWGGGGERLAVD